MSRWLNSLGNAVFIGSSIIMTLVSNPHKYITSNTVKLIGNIIQNSLCSELYVRLEEASPLIEVIIVRADEALN